MASVIRNPIILHCLDQFGITPEEARAVESGKAPVNDRREANYAAFIANLPEFVRGAEVRAEDGS